MERKRRMEPKTNQTVALGGAVGSGVAVVEMSVSATEMKRV